MKNYPDSKMLFTELEEHQEELFQLLRKLIRIRSYSGQEDEIVEFIVSKMKEFGFEEAFPDMLGNAVGRIGSGPVKILYDAHVDTVRVTENENWEFPPFEGHIENGRIFGRGSVDEKPAMAGFLLAAKVLRKFLPPEEWPFTLYVCGSVLEEDCDGFPLLHLIETEEIVPDFVVLGEPTDLKVYRGQRGRMELQISAFGKSAHGAHNQKGVNAIYKLNRVISEIEKLDKNLPEKPPLGKGSITVSQMITSGPSLCSVPDFARIHIDRRLTVDENRESVLKELGQILSKTGMEGEIAIPEYQTTSWKGFTVMQEAYFPTWILEEDHVLVKAAQQAVNQVFATSRPTSFWSFSTNGVASSGRLGIPTIGFAPGKEELAHSDRESILLYDLLAAAKFYTQFPFKLLSMLDNE